MSSTYPRRIRSAAEFGPIVAEGRNGKGQRQEDFAAMLGISRKTLSELERGVAENTSSATALRALSLAGYAVEVMPLEESSDAQLPEQNQPAPLKRILILYLHELGDTYSWSGSDRYSGERLLSKLIEPLVGLLASIPAEGELFSPNGPEGRKFLFCLRVLKESPEGFDGAVVAAHGQKATLR